VRARPLFIALEGLDGAGTTTQCERLVAWLRQRGRPVVATREPSDGRVGRLIRELLRAGAPPFDPSALALLFAADRLAHLADEIRPALRRGEDVVTDRYAMSSLAYQGAGGNLPWVRQLNARADDPDVTVLLQVSVDVCLERLAERGGPRDIYEERAALEAIAAGYRELADGGAGGRVEVVSGERPADEVEQAVRAIVEALLGEP
jgi:dTMP kinase